MNLKKFLLNIVLLITILAVSMVITNYSVSASSEYEYITTTSGDYLTYKGTSIKVEIPVNYEQQATEFRGVWVSPFAGDITGFTQTAEIYQKELLSVLDNMEKFNLNAIVFHIRTHNDAYYNTNLAPKSGYISAANFSQWDYLTWFIDECHERGIEFHAWLNPYRISSTSITFNEIKEKYENYRINPAYYEENVLIGTGGAILDPGRPAVRDYLVDVCMEIIKKYDVDAIHFDDYFYMSGIDDSKTYQQYKSNYNNVSIEEFRRLQIDEFIETLSNEMYEYNISHNRCVQLGISPSGVYRNGSYSTNYQWDENGTLISPVASNTTGYAHYGSPLYSDTKKWIDNEWIDYITPQLYGSFENTGMPYADTLDWWAQVVKYKKVNLYTGIGIYQATGTSDKGWYTAGNNTLELSLRYNQKHDTVDGFCLYQYRTLRNSYANNPDFVNVFTTMVTNKALAPSIPRYLQEVEAPSNLQLIKGEDTYSLLFDSVDNAYKYAIFRVEGKNQEIDITDANNLVAIVGNKEINAINFSQTTDNYTYGVLAVSKSNNCSPLTTISADQATTELNIPFGKLNSITISGKIESNGYYNLVVEKADVYIGNDVSYKIYSSMDKENWELVYEVATLQSLTFNARFKFNDYLHPVYYKVVIENSFGAIESEIITVDFRKVNILEIFEYSLKNSNEAFLDIFKLD